MSIALNSISSVDGLKAFLYNYHKVLRAEHRFPPLGLQKSLHVAAKALGVDNWHVLLSDLHHAPAFEDPLEIVPLIMSWRTQSGVPVDTEVPQISMTRRLSLLREVQLLQPTTRADYWSLALIAYFSNMADQPFFVQNQMVATVNYNMTDNPFRIATAFELETLIHNFRDAFSSTGSTDMWTQHAGAMFRVVLGVLFYMCDSDPANGLPINRDTQLTPTLINQYLALDTLVNFAHLKFLPLHIRQPVIDYISSIPGYSEHDFLLGNMSPKVYEQHGRFSMQYHGHLANLALVFG